jgi:hypothetical protein
MYGKNVVRRQLEMLNLHILVRGHQSVPCGIELLFDSMVATVSSSSIGDKGTPESPGVLEIIGEDTSTWKKHVFTPLPIVRRSDVQLLSSDLFNKRSRSMKAANRRSLQKAASLGTLMAFVPMASGEGTGPTTPARNSLNKLRLSRQPSMVEWHQFEL